MRQTNPYFLLEEVLSVSQSLQSVLPLFKFYCEDKDTNITYHRRTVSANKNTYIARIKLTYIATLV